MIMTEKHFFKNAYIYYSMKLQDIPQRVHFVGVGGIGMSALAQYLHLTGHTVTGSDRTSNEQTQALAKLGVRVYIGHNKYNVRDAELVVHTSAVHDDNLELTEAKKNGVPVILREELLGTVFNSFPVRIAVCGTHGKTTVTAMIHQLLASAKVDHSAFIGGLYNGTNFYFGDNIVVAEACEYNRSFFNLKPTVTVCTNAEYDHPDCYRSKNAVRRAFKKFLASTDVNGTVILPRSLHKLAPDNIPCIYFDDALTGEVRFKGGKPRFVASFGKCQQEVKLDIVGRHNVYNALAALAAGCALNIPLSDGVVALERFTGVDRRWTEYNCRFKCVFDYAHHPTEIACAVESAKNVAKGRVICVFQPHTYTRTKTFFKKFVTCFSGADIVAYLPIYSAREKPIRGVNSLRLARLAAKTGLNAKYFADFKTVSRWLNQVAEPSDLVLILGAGDIVNLHSILCPKPV